MVRLAAALVGQACRSSSSPLIGAKRSGEVIVPALADALLRQRVGMNAVSLPKPGIKPLAGMDRAAAFRRS